MSLSKEQKARAFAFAGATLLIGVMIFFFTQGIIPFVELPDIAGSVILLGFALVFLNLSFAVARRFCSKTFEWTRYSYILGLILILPTLILSAVTERFSGVPGYLLFAVMISVASATGVWFGIKSGKKKRDNLIREALESGDTENEKEG